MSAPQRTYPGFTITVTVNQLVLPAGSPPVFQYNVHMEGPSGTIVVPAGQSQIDVGARWETVIAWVQDVIAGELAVGLGRLDEQTHRI